MSKQTREEYDEYVKRAMAESEAARAEWFTKWPNACKHCEGRGGSWYSYDPSPAGVSLGSGSMYDCDPCAHCTNANAGELVKTEDGDEWTVQLGFCARCHEPMDIESDKPCPSCAWDWGRGLDDFAPPIPDFDPYFDDEWNMEFAI